MNPRILVYRMGAFGDTLLTLGAIDTLRQNFAGCEITLAANPAYGAPLLDAGRTDKLLDAGAPPFHLLFAETDSPGEGDFSHLLREYDVLVFFSRDPEGALSRRLEALRPAAVVLTPPFPSEESTIHISGWMTTALIPVISEAIPGPPAPLQPSDTSRQNADALIEPLIGRDVSFLALHPGGGGRQKWPPPQILARLARSFCEKTSARPLLIQGPADDDACKIFKGEWNGEVPVLENPPTPTLAGILAKARAYLGGDSGVSHLAALCGTPTLALFGPTSAPRRWAPMGVRAMWNYWEDEAGTSAKMRRLVASAEEGKP